MANAHATLAIIGSVLAALTALIALDFLLVLPAAFGVVVGIYIILRMKEEKPVLAVGVVAVLAGLLGVMGGLGGLNVGGLGAGFSWLSVSFAAALTIIACLSVAATLLVAIWDDLPRGGAIAAAVALGLAVLLALIFNKDLTSFFAPWTFIVAVLSLGGLYPGIVAARTS